VLTLADLKKHYDAVGSYLHVPSLNQLQSGQVPDPAKLREHCEAAVRLVENILSSQLWNAFSGTIATLDECMNEDCKKPIRKRMLFGKDTLDAQCFECNAEYVINSEPDGRALWTPKTIDAPCSTPGCPEKMALWLHEVRPETRWLCRGCGVHNVITLTVTKLRDERLDPAVTSSEQNQAKEGSPQPSEGH